MLDASGGRNKTARFGRKSVHSVEHAVSSRGRRRALFIVCALLGAILGLMPVLSGPSLLNRGDLKRAPVVAQQKIQELTVLTGAIGLAGLDKAARLNEKLLQTISEVKYPSLAGVKQRVIVAYAPFIRESARAVYHVTQKINVIEQAAMEKAVEFTAMQKFTISPRIKHVVPVVEQVAVTAVKPVPSSNPLQKVLEDVDRFAQIAPAAGDSPAESSAAEGLPTLSGEVSEKHEVQSILIARRQAVISSGMSGKILEFPFQNGDIFAADDVLVKFDCAIENALYSEKSAALRLAAAELKAKKQLHKLGTLSEIEYIAATESVAQEQARLDQVGERVQLCAIKAPFDGRVTNKTASPYEYAERGRVLMEIAASEPLLLQFLVPSVWLRWLNVGTPFDVYVEESGKTYQAKVIRVHGKIDPVSQTAEIVAEMSAYQEELLPGMGGKAIFDVGAARKKIPLGFIGLKVAAMPEDAPQGSGNE